MHFDQSAAPFDLLHQLFQSTIHICLQEHIPSDALARQSFYNGKKVGPNRDASHGVSLHGGDSADRGRR